jgi:protein SCO1/2
MKPLERVADFVSGWRFPTLVLSVLGLFTLLVGVLAAWPPAPTGLGAMAEQFRVWCLSGDPTNGHASPAAIVATLSELLVLMGILAWFWRRPLATALRTQRVGLAKHVLAGAVVVAGLTGWMAAIARPLPTEPAAFPAAGLRTAIPAPDFTLVDQTGQPVTRSALEGRVLLVTGVYASCGLACPRILSQARRAVAALTPEERDEVTVLGVTLDPEHDDAARMVAMATAQKVAAPTFRLLTGPVEDVNRTLDAFDVTRKRNPDTGLIDHANVFVLIDRQGRVAYRFGLSEQQEQWLTEGLRVLVREPRSRTAMQE